MVAQHTQDARLVSHATRSSTYQRSPVLRTFRRSAGERWKSRPIAVRGGVTPCRRTHEPDGRTRPNGVCVGVVMVWGEGRLDRSEGVSIPGTATHIPHLCIKRPSRMQHMQRIVPIPDLH